MITKDGRDTPIERITPDNYIVPKGEESSYHCIIEVEQFDPKTGKRLSKPRLQKFGRKIFETHVQSSLRKQGYKVIILHNPTEWLKAHQEEAAQRAKDRAEAAKKAEQERFDAAVAAAVAKALADQKAQQESGAKQEVETEQEIATEPASEAETEQEPKKPGRKPKQTAEANVEK